MYYLIYASQTKHKWTQSDLSALLKKSREKNEQLGITGMLAYLNNRFIQILEGEEKAVRKLMDQITRDTRHEKIIQVLEGEISVRNFQGWSMGFESINEKELEQLKGYSNLENAFPDSRISNSSHPALIFLKLFYDKNYKDFNLMY